MVEVSLFDFARLMTIKQYSDLEYQLCLLLQACLQTDVQSAATIFHRVSNTRARYAIIGDLLKEREEGLFKSHWNRIEKWLGPLDGLRNQMVHWSEDYTTVIVMDGSEVTDVSKQWHLINPATRWQSSSYGSRLQQQEVWEARDRMRVMMHIVNRLHLSVHQREQWPWRDIYLQSIGNLNPVEYLSLLNDKGSPAQLPPYAQMDLTWEHLDQSQY